MVYELPAGRAAPLVRAKVDSQLARAMRYVESVGARAVVPSAGPPCFLDPELFHLNVIDGDEPSIFVDQRAFLERLADVRPPRHPRRARHDDRRARPTTSPSHHPVRRRRRSMHIFTDKAAAPRSAYQADWLPWIDELKAGWTDHDDVDLLPTLQAWWEPLLAMAPTLRAAVGAACLLRAGDVEVLIDFPAGEVRPYAGEAVRASGSRSTAPLVEAVVAERAVDWSNSLFLSCRFRAWRDGEFNEWVYNFFKSLSVERMRRTEAEAVRRLDPPTETEPDIELGDWIVQRRCPHRNADLAVFGEIEDCTLTCTLHGWRFDLETGRCLTAADHPLRVRRARDAAESR